MYKRQNGTQYDLYLDGRYYATYKKKEAIKEEFRDLQVYEEDEKWEKK